jgi:hypothetical protein
MASSITINLGDAFLLDTPPNSEHLYREISIEELGGLITAGSPIPKGFCSERILQQIQQGGLDSKRLKNKYKNALKIFLGIE